MKMCACIEQIMLLSIVIFPCVISQLDMDITPFVPPSVCYSCDGEVNNTACNENVTTCAIGESCQNVVVDNDAYGLHLIYKGCQGFYRCAYSAGLGCLTNTTTNTTTCLYCCIGELCNVDEGVALVVPDFLAIIYQTLIEDHAKRQLILNMVVGIVASICLIAAVIAIASTGLTSKTAPFIHLNLCVSMLLSQLLIMLRTTALSSENGCKLLSFLIHYFYLVGAFHFALEGVHLLFTVALNALSVWKKWQIVLISWGLPFIITVITIGVKTNGYGMPTPLQKYCWLSFLFGTWWALFVPIALVIFFSIICVITVGVLRNRVKDESDDDKYKKFRSNYTAFSVVLITYIATWLLAFIELDPFKTTVPYVFFAVHALLGIMVSLFYCAFNFEVNCVLKAKISPN